MSRIAPLSPIISSDIRDLDLSEPVEDTLFGEIEAALNRTHLLVFRDLMDQMDQEDLDLE